jgi:hypothetical protein
MLPLPDIQEVALVGYMVDGGCVTAYMLVEVAHEYDLGAPALVMFDEFCEVVFEVVPWICIFPFFLAERKFLLVISSDASLIGWFRAYLVGRDNDDRFARKSVEGDVRPSPIRVAIVCLD